MECAIAGAMLVLTASVWLQFFTAAAAQRRASRWRETAYLEAANALERVALRPWESLTPEKTADVRLSDDAARMLPEGKLTIEIAPVPGTPEAKRLAATVHWEPQPGFPQKVRLVAWRHRRP
ncbi:MAG: hypothetical protein NUV77_13740 [Thermoguttaceae bacterium]|nr:hypothetical protein [Thermoguttaceae bacterium]